MSLVSVVIPNYNYGRFVEQAVDSVLKQSYPEVEVILVDNGSTDDSLARLEKYRGRIKIIAQENRGQAGARNRGIAESSGEIIAFCDADDAWRENKLAKQMECFDRAEVGLVYSGYYLCDQDLRPLSQMPARNRGKVLSLFADGSAAVIPAGESSVLIRRSVLDRTGVFDESLSISSGFDLYRRISQHFEIEAVGEPLVMYRQHVASASRSADAFAEDYLKALGKMFDDPGAACLLPRKSACFGRAHVSLSGAFFHQGDFAAGFTHLAKGLAFNPREIGYVLKFGNRYFGRRKFTAKRG